MDKQILNQYIDACELVKETEAEIRRLKKRRKSISMDSVKGSMHDFPYAAKSFHIEGVPYSVVCDPGKLEAEERLLEERKIAAGEVKLQVEEWLNTVSHRMQRIIKYRIFEGNGWEEVAQKLGRKATGDSVRMEFERFMKIK